MKFHERRRKIIREWMALLAKGASTAGSAQPNAGAGISPVGAFPRL